jgi:hypothetical protein
MTCDVHGEWRLTDRPWRLATSFTLQAILAWDPTACGPPPGSTA